MTAKQLNRNCYFLLSSVSVILYVLFEWLFTITRVSFLASAPLVTQFRTLFISSALLLLPLVISYSVLALIGQLGWQRLATSIQRTLAMLCILTGSILFLDTIVYSLSRFGLSSLDGWLTLIPAGLSIILGYDIWVRLKSVPHTTFRRRASFCIATLSVAGSLIPALFASHSEGFHYPCNLTDKSPNIVILSSDGISAERMSVYDYHRDTTPYLRTLASQSQVFDNAFSNSRRTTSSISSMLSGRSSLETGIIYYPDFYRGEDAYRHLPGLLKQCGYNTIDVSLRDIIDPFEMNMRRGFDIANGRERSLFDNIPPEFDEEKLFLLMIVDKIIDRVGHLSGMQPKQDFLKDVLALTGERHSEENKIENVLEYLHGSSAPVFAHIHLMGTHGRRFFPRHPLFSKGQEQSAQWLRDFYDDAILDFDHDVKLFVEQLQKMGLFDSTLLIITSDHAINSGFGRIPFIVHYPMSALNGRVTENVQRLDIPATVIDFLHIPKPDWIAGLSFLRALPADRPIYFIDQVNEGELKEPWRNLKSLGVIVCDWLATIEVNSGNIRIGKVSGHTGACPKELDKTTAKALLTEELKKWR